MADLVGEEIPAQSYGEGGDDHEDAVVLARKNGISCGSATYGSNGRGPPVSTRALRSRATAGCIWTKRKRLHVSFEGGSWSSATQTYMTLVGSIRTSMDTRNGAVALVFEVQTGCGAWKVAMSAEQDHLLMSDWSQHQQEKRHRTVALSISAYECWYQQLLRCVGVYRIHDRRIEVQVLHTAFNRSISKLKSASRLQQ
jgi:hypothetical protein